jgi:hypothetical protein
MASEVPDDPRQLPRHQAAITPVRMPSSTAITVPVNTIGTVFHSASRRLSATGRWSVNETPMFPRSSSRRYSRYCSNGDLSRPNCRSRLAFNSGVACGTRARLRTASPGSTRKRKKFRVVATKIVATANPIRFSR